MSICGCVTLSTGKACQKPVKANEQTCWMHKNKCQKASSSSSPPLSPKRRTKSKSKRTEKFVKPEGEEKKMNLSDRMNEPMTRSEEAAHKQKASEKLQEKKMTLVDRMNEPMTLAEEMAQKKKQAEEKFSQKRHTLPTLMQVLSIYKYNFLDTHALKFVKHHEAAARQEISQELRVIYQDDHTLKEVRDHLNNRYPIHMMSQAFNKNIEETNLQSILGITKKNFENNKHSDAKLRYVVLGPVVMDAKLCGLQRAWICHAWGVNLESKTTPDAHYVFAHGLFDIDRYENLLYRSLVCIITACDYLRAKFKQIIVLRMTKLGFGAWATEIPTSTKTKLNAWFSTKLRAFCLSRSSWLQIRLPQYPSNFTSKTGYPSKKANEWEQAEENDDPFGPPLSSNRKNFTAYPPNCINVFVNAWDDFSFIGNGGSQDNTLDGWMVAGGAKNFSTSRFGKPMGFHYVNTSFLHNAFFYNLHDKQFIPAKIP